MPPSGYATQHGYDTQRIRPAPGVSEKTAWRAKRKNETSMQELTGPQALVAHEQERAREGVEDAPA
jgi:hypothetical protein